MDRFKCRNFFSHILPANGKPAATAITAEGTHFTGRCNFGKEFLVLFEFESDYFVIEVESFVCK